MRPEEEFLAVKNRSKYEYNIFQDEWNKTDQFLHSKIKLKNDAHSIAVSMDMHSLRLKFQAYIDKFGTLLPITRPVYSQPIYNQSI